MARATIKGLRASWGSWGSGIATLVVEDHNGELGVLHADDGPLIRALDACFGCIVPGHGVDVSRVVGQEIEYELDDLGLCLTGFQPV